VDQDVLYIGMDLGSLKTSIAASNGKRETLLTAVGWPKDHVARAMLGCDIVFGEHTIGRRMALDVLRPFAKGALKYVTQDETGVSRGEVPRHKEAASLIVRHAVSLMEPPPGAALYGVLGAPSRATIENKQTLIDTVQGTFDAVVIVAEPFSVAFGMNRLTDTLVVDIGAGTIDICPIYGTYPDEKDQLTLPVGGDAVDEEFHRRVRELYPEAQLSLNMARAIKEKHGFVYDLDDSAVVTLPVDGRLTKFDVTEPLKQACKSIVPPIVEGLREVIASFDPEFQRSMLENILLAGGGSQMKGLDRLVEEALEPYGGGNVTKVYDSVFAGAVGALKLAMNMPRDHWQELEALNEQSDDSELKRAA
jgi:rod shape-determining protein MreB